MNSSQPYYEITPLKEISLIVFTLSYFMFLKFFYPPVFYMMCICMTVAIITVASPKKLIPLNLLIFSFAVVGFLTGALGLKNFRSL